MLSIADGTGIEGADRQAAFLKLNEREVVAGGVGDDAAAIAFAAFGRDDADDEVFFLAGQFDDMGVGQHLVWRDRKAAAMADEIGFAAVRRHDGDADNAARGGGDVLLFGARCRGQGEGEQDAEAAEEFDHDAAHSYGKVWLRQSGNALSARGGKAGPIAPVIPYA